jgi:hypothetical protein
MAANGFPSGEREGGLKKPRRGLPEPLGEILFFLVFNLVFKDAETLCQQRM